jgi:WD40 repeat protein
MLDDSSKSTEQEEWRTKTLEYVTALNAFHEKAFRDGWDKVGKPPEDPGLEHLAQAAITALRDANRTGEFDRLRQLWPPAQEPLIPHLQENGQSIPVVCILPDKSILARIGAPYEQGRTVRIVGNSVHEVEGVPFFGRCPNRRFFAIAKPHGVEVFDGWGGPRTGVFAWPTGLEGAPSGFTVKPLSAPPTPTRLVPFPDGQRVLFVGCDGVFVLSAEGSVRLLPTTEAQKSYFEYSLQEHPDDDLYSGLSMEHGAVSRDGKWIAVGCQDSTHLVFDDSLNLVGDIGNRSDYPHFALFSSDDRLLAVNSCHFYNGVTLGVSVDLLPGLKTEQYKEDGRIVVLEDGARVYAGACREGEFMVGDASGFVRAFNTDGKRLWHLFIGSSVGDMDISDDGKTLVVSTFAGFLSIIDLDFGQQAPHQIGDSKHMESRRWIFWKNEEHPLIW